MDVQCSGSFSSLHFNLPTTNRPPLFTNHYSPILDPLRDLAAPPGRSRSTGGSGRSGDDRATAEPALLGRDAAAHRRPLLRRAAHPADREHRAPGVGRPRGRDQPDTGRQGDAGKREGSRWAVKCLADTVTWMLCTDAHRYGYMVMYDVGKLTGLNTKENLRRRSPGTSKSLLATDTSMLRYHLVNPIRPPHFVVCLLGFLGASTARSFGPITYS